MSIFARFAARSGRPEPIATESLGYILHHSEPARRALAGFLAVAGVEQGSLDRIVTEDTSGEAGRPDLAAYDDDHVLRLLIEAKFWAGLTDNQPVSYLNQLKASRGVLLFLVPEKRMEMIWRELHERLARAEIEVGEDPSTAQLRVAKLKDGRQLVATSWTALLGHLRDGCSRASDRSATGDIDQLLGLCLEMETVGFVPLSAEQLSNVDVPRQALMLADLVDPIKDRAVALGVFSTKRLRATATKYASGAYVAYPQAGGWIGLDFSRWARFGCSPMWLVFHDSDWGRATKVRKALRSMHLSRPQRAFDEDGGCFVVPLWVRPGAVVDVVVSDIVEQLIGIGKLLEAEGLPVDPSVGEGALVEEWE